MAAPGEQWRLLRTFLRSDGSVDLKVNDKGQPINLYYNEFNDGPPWIEQVCKDYSNGIPAPAPFAGGPADLEPLEFIELS